MKFLDYIQGFRKGKDAHRLEHEAMTDPFLADAIDGYDSIEGNHGDRIAGMQAHIQKRTIQHNKKRAGIWKVGIAAIAFIALLGGYFSLMNHESAMLAAHDSDNSYITIYAPEGYIERKGIELAELQEAGKDTSLHTAVDIVNLHEVIKPIERINIYMPDLYYAQLNDKELHELSSIRERIAPEAPRYPESPSEIVLAEERPDEVLDMDISLDAPLVAEKISAPIPENKDINTTAEPAQVLAGRVSGIEVENSQQGAFYDRSFAKERPIEKEVLAKRVVKGKVVDEANEPLIGVTVVAKGTNIGTVTDVDGNYQLNIDSAKDVDLIANYIGYETIEIPKAKNDQVIAMKESQQTLDEVVVVGYGTQKKSMVTGSVSTVKSEKIVETQPKPLIGDKAYKKYLEDNLIRPEDSTDCKKGNVTVEFNVDSSGRPVNISVTKGLCELFDKEAIRLVESGPDWTQGTARVKVEVKF